jgi:hypothetical protein
MGVTLNNFKGIAKGVWASPLNPMECGIFHIPPTLVVKPRHLRDPLEII